MSCSASVRVTSAMAASVATRLQFVAGRPHGATTLLIARNRIERFMLTSGPKPNPPASSLLRRLGVPLDCLSPDCQVGSTRRGVLQAFGVGG